MAEKKGILRLDFRDVYGKRLAEKVDISLRNMSLQHEVVVRGVTASKLVRVKELHTAPDAIYRIEVDPPSYRPVSAFGTAAEGSRPPILMLPFPVDPAKVTAVEFAAFGDLFRELQQALRKSDSVPLLVGKKGKALYEGLDDVRRAGLMNVAHKSAATMLAGGRTVFSYIQRFAEVQGDRIFVHVDGELFSALENTVAAGIMDPVSGALHELPAAIPDFDDYQDVGSYKTEDTYGNLQVTLFRNGDDFIADIDIDDCNGLRHLFQVLRNHLTGEPTHPYDIHEILMRHQGLFPNYELLVS
jgi:hypothetical protein